MQPSRVESSTRTTRLAVLASSPVGPAMAGPGIRAYHFAKELADHFDVTLWTPTAASLPLEGVRVERLADRSGAAVGRALAPFDVVVAQALPVDAIRRLARAGTRVIYDLYVPYHLERLAFLEHQALDRAGTLFARAASHAQRLALATGSAFVCASERQRDLWLGVLAAFGRLDLERYRRDPPARDLIEVVPFGLSPEPPRGDRRALKGIVPGIDAHDRVLLWAGGIWNWLDPLTVIRAVESVTRTHRDVKLFFLGFQPPTPGLRMAMAQRALDLARSLGLLDRVVFFNRGWTPYERRQAYLLEADVGVSAHFDTLETRYAFRGRLLDHFWAGLPTITTRGDVLADLVAARDLGRVVGFGDVEGWAAAIEEVLADAAARERVARNAAPVCEELAWPRAVEPLVRLAALPDTGRSARVRIAAAAATDRWLRLRTSLALGGPRGLVRREVRKVFSEEPAGS